jgi:D-beta-D-heptose 7-phosphate kinase/D-beta-D-heptose 1-phosphate adenosyltransferase
MSRHQQLMRLDFENTKTSPAISAQQVSSDLLKDHDVVILSDYGKGALSQCGELIAAIKKSGVPILVDPKGHDFSKYSGASVITPNMSEFEAVVGECESDAVVESQGRDLMSQLQLDALLVTRSEKGITLLQGGESPWHMPTQAKDVFDVTGAGDTVIATLAACVGAGESYQSAARWANIAAGIVVGKSGTSSVAVSELQAANDQLHLSSRGVISESEVKQLVKTAQAQGEKVVVTNGCFDILHAGHVTYLQEAAKLGDRLVVAVNSDETVRELKGPERPVNPVDNRMTVLSALACVDWVVRFDEMTPERMICELKPDFLVKGGDNDPANIPGNQCVWDAGGQVFALTYVDGVSTTQIVESIKKR